MRNNRKITAHYVVNPGEEPIPHGIIELSDQGEILALRRNEDSLQEEDHLEYYPGILVPGFVNVHGHMELCHMKDLVPKHTGIADFVKIINTQRGNTGPDPSLVEAYLAKMHQQGTQAIGDIANTADALMAKTKSKILSHTFIELFGLNPQLAPQIWQQGLKLLDEFQHTGLSASLTPHAPYSVSEELWARFGLLETPIFSIHNQESEEENAFIQTATGPMAERFIKSGVSADHFPPTTSSSLHLYFRHLGLKQDLLLVHNTCTREEEFDFVRDVHQGRRFWALCPNSNEYIEQSFPHFIASKYKDEKICLGTDSLASNTSLSVWEEAKTLVQECPQMKLEELIQILSLNGAEALNFQDQIGSFEKGKKPGVVLLEGIDLQQLKVTKHSKSRRLV